MDIKPTSCPCPLSTTDTGTTSVAILGTSGGPELYKKIDPASVKLEGVSQQAGSKPTIMDVAAPYTGTFSGQKNDCTTAGPDTYKDLVLKFKTQDLITALGSPLNNDDVKVMKLTGEFKPADGITDFEGQDVVVINKNTGKKKK